MVANVAQFPDWKTKLAKRKNGEPYGDERNVLMALEYAPELAGLLRYDAFKDAVIFCRAPLWHDHKRAGHGATGMAWSDEHRVHLQRWLQDQGLPVARPHVVHDCVIAYAKNHPHHQLRDELSRLKWDERTRLDDWLHDYLGARGDKRYLAAVGRAFMIAAVARAFDPGCKADNVLVLESPQGRGKSTAISILNYGYGTDYLPDLQSRDAALQLQGTWINELSELASFAKSDNETIKAFLTRTHDRYRPPYGRNTVERPRHCVFIATTNLNEYLKDETGGRRFWPVRCRDIHLDMLEADRDQLWAEAMHAYHAKETWHLSRDLEPLAEAEQTMRRVQSEQEIRLLEYLDALLKDGKHEVLMRDLLHDVAGFEDLSKHGREAGGVALSFSRVLAGAGWERQKPIGRGVNRRQPYRFVGLNGEFQLQSSL